MGNFNQGRSDGKFNRGGGGGRGFGGGKSFGGGGRGFGGGRSERPEMHRATCDECGNSCEVPFKPSGDKPVYCSNCFKKDGASGGDRSRGRDSGRDGGRDFGRDRGRDFGRDKQMFEAVCAECGNDCEVPFKPTGDKPVLCSNCFGGNAPSRDRFSGKSEKSADKSGEKHDEILAKLDKILNLLQRTNSVKEVTVMKSESSKEAKKEAKEEVMPKEDKKKVIAKKAAPKKVAKPATKAKAEAKPKKK